MKLTNKQIKKIISEELRIVLKEADLYSCNQHSLGFIDDKGKYIDIDKVAWTTTHSGYMEGYLEDKKGFDFSGMSEDDKRKIINKTPKGWIKISRADEITYEGTNWEKAKKEGLIEGLIEMWMACSKYSPWLKNKALVKTVKFRSDSGEETLTIDKFLDAYGTPEQLNRLFNYLMK
jgi:hypothetical protein